MSHSLDLSNEVHFPLYKDLPIDGEDNPKFFKQSNQEGYVAPVLQWCFLAEIVAVDPPTSGHTLPLFKVKDKSGQLVRVVFHFARPSSFDVSQCKVGHTMCIMFACRRFFRGGTRGHGIHEDNGDNIEMLPNNLPTVLSIGRWMKKGSRSCTTCGVNKGEKGCRRCGTRYCSVQCQKQDWKNGRPSHRNTCVSIHRIREWWHFSWKD